ncbi:MAG: hydroxymethylglutaryl-CoA lyase, partial [Streptosporangiaceae bacterium]
MPARAPAAHRRAGLPEQVEIYEVGPRDGLQNEAATVPVATKAGFVERLVAAGLRTVEATSFVSPKWVPQLADAGDLFPRLPRAEGVKYPVLVPNLAGLERALAAGVSHIAVFASATDTFARRNLNRSLDDSLAMFAPVVAEARSNGLWVRGYLSMCFGDPWEGPVPVEQVAGVAGRLMAQGCDQLSLGDTIGVGTPGHT